MNEILLVPWFPYDIRIRVHVQIPEEVPFRTVVGFPDRIARLSSHAPLKEEAKIARGNAPGTQDRPRTISVGASETSRPNPPLARPVRA